MGRWRLSRGTGGIVSEDSNRSAEGGEIRIIGAVDLVTTLAVSGWAIDPAGSEAVQLEILVEDLHVGEVTADLPRPDLMKAGFRESACGFVFKFPTESRPPETSSVTVR